MELNSYAVLIHRGVLEDGISMIVNSTEKLSNEEVKEIAMSKLRIEIEEIPKGKAHGTKQN